MVKKVSLVMSLVAACLFSANAATVSGTVLNSVTNNPVAGAIVTLTLVSAGGAATFTDTTDALGNYTLTNVTAANYPANGMVTAAATGYITSTPQVVRITAATSTVTVDIDLVPRAAGVAISGTVTEQGTTTPIAGAKIYLRQLTVIVDSAVTASDGTYSIDSVQAGNYQMQATATGYTSSTPANLTVAAAPVTRNFQLVKTAVGNLYVIVLKRTDSTAVAGASVAVATFNGGMLTGTSDASGYAPFENIGVGYYNITVTAAGYAAGTGTTQITANLKDTVRIYLVVSAGGTKTLRGTVTDSVSGSVLANVRVVLVITGGGIGGTLTLFDSTNASGAYSITGIPANRNTGAVTVSVTGYRNYNNTQVTLGQMNQADTSTLNIRLVPIVGIAPFNTVMAASGKPVIIMTGARLELRNIDESGIVSVVSANGRVVFRTSIAAHTASMELPKSKVAAGTYLVNITQKSGVISKPIIMQ